MSNNSISKTDKYNLIYAIALSFIFAAGIFIRLFFYLKNPPMYVDECLLALNFMDNVNIFGPLENLQKAPLLFLLLSKLNLNLFGYSEYSCRLIPLIASIISIPFMHIAASRFLDKKLAIIIVDVLFVISPVLIFYSYVFKPYPSDVAIICIFLIAAGNTKFYNDSYLKNILIAVSFFVFSLFSYPVEFFIAAWILSMIPKCLDKEKFKKLSIYIITFLLSTSYCLYSFIFDNSTQSFVKYWPINETSCFISLNLKSIVEVNLHNLNYYFFDKFLFNIPENYQVLPYIVIIALFIILGIIIFIVEKKKNYQFILWVIILAHIASYLKLYPMAERMVLYQLPIILILLVKPIDFLFANIKRLIKTRKFLLFSAYLCFILVFISSFTPYYVNYLNYFKHNIYLSNEISPKDVVKYIIENKSKNSEIIAIGYSTATARFYYKTFANDDKIIIFKDYTDINENTRFSYISNTFTKLNKNKTYWIYPMFMEDKDCKNIIIKYLKNNNIKYEEIKYHNNSLIKMYL